MLGEIEHHIGRVGFDLVDDQRRFVPDAQSAHFVADVFQRLDDMGFGGEIFGL